MQNDAPTPVPLLSVDAPDGMEQELIRGLQSMDPTERLLAEVWLIENGEESMDLMENAITNGAVSPCVVGRCMAEILHRKLRGETRSATTWLLMDAASS